MPKVKYGLKNAHYAIVTETTDSTGAVTSSYGTVKAWPGSVSISLEAQGEDSPFYADDGVYYMAGNNNGYSGTLETSLVPEDVYTAVMGQTKDVNGVVSEKATDVKKYIALMFEFTTDDSARRFLFYRCSLTRPAVASQTRGENIEVATETVNLTITPRPGDQKVKDYVDQGAPAYAGWYSAVYSGGATPVPSIELSTHAFTVADNAEFTLVATVVPAGQTVTWASDNTSVASVDAGVVTGEGEGNTTIKASITVDGVTYTDTATAVVTA